MPGRVPSFMMKGDASSQKMAALQSTAAAQREAEAAAAARAAQEAEEAEPTQMVLKIEDLKAFYLSPYLTCSECNAVVFINATMLRDALIADADPSANRARLKLEALPECSGCGRTYAYHVGAKDLSALIAANKRALARKRARELAASIVLQRIQRGIFGREEYARRSAAKHLFRRLLNRGAVIIQSQYRGRLGRREAVTELSLQLIKNAHKKLLKMSLVNRFGLRVFWFKAKLSCCCCSDHKLLSRRLGNEPPVHAIEGIVPRLLAAFTNCSVLLLHASKSRGVLGRNSSAHTDASVLTVAHKQLVRSIQRAYRDGG